MEYFAGLDVSMEATAVCVVDAAGRVVREGKCASEPKALVGWLRGCGVALRRIGLEAGPLSGWLWSGLCAAGLAAECIETRRLRGMTAALPVKSDRTDARAIAQAMRCGLYRAVHVKSETSQELRFLLGSRQQLLRLRIDLDNGLRGTLKAFGLKIGEVGPGRFADRVLALVREQAALVAVVQPLLVARAALERQFAVLDAALRRVVRTHAVCRRLMTIPGVGPVASLAYVTALDDPARFGRSREVGAYLGLTPRRYQSGVSDRSGPISKAGDRLAREALFLAAHAADPGQAVLGVESLGHGRGEAARAAAGERRAGAAFGGADASPLGRWHGVPLVARRAGGLGPSARPWSRADHCHDDTIRAGGAGSRRDGGEASSVRVLSPTAIGRRARRRDEAPRSWSRSCWRPLVDHEEKRDLDGASPVGAVHQRRTLAAITAIREGRGGMRRAPCMG